MRLAYPNPSIQRALFEAHQAAGAKVRPLSWVMDGAARSELLSAGIQPPPPPVPSAQAAKATATRIAGRQAAPAPAAGVGVARPNPSMNVELWAAYQAAGAKVRRISKVLDAALRTELLSAGIQPPPPPVLTDADKLEALRNALDVAVAEEEALYERAGLSHGAPSEGHPLHLDIVEAVVWRLAIHGFIVRINQRIQ